MTKPIALLAAAFLVSQPTLGIAYAESFVCKEITLTRMMAKSAKVGDNLLPKSATLYLDINAAEPSRSTLRWGDAPLMRNATTTWPVGTRIIVEGGTFAVSFSASNDGIASVGTATLDAKGALRVVENTVAGGEVVFDVLEAACLKAK